MTNEKKNQVDVEPLKDNGTVKSNLAKTKMSGRDAVLAMSKLFNDEEKDFLGRYQAEEEARKAALYG